MDCIYILRCPVSGAIRYVGKTSLPLSVRLEAHISEARCKNLGHRGSWIRSLLAKELVPRIAKDADIPNGHCWKELERKRIAHYKSVGCRLVNGTEGGEGLQNPTAEVRARMSLAATNRKYSEAAMIRVVESAKRIGRANKGKKRSQEHRAKVGASNRARVVSSETRAKMSIAQARRARAPHSQATRDKISAAFKGRVLTPEHRQKIGFGSRNRTPEYRATMAETMRLSWDKRRNQFP